MKILYSHRTKSADGQYVHIRALTDALREQGDDLSIVGPEGVSKVATRSLDAGSGTSEKGVKKWSIPKPVYETAEMGYSLPAYQKLYKAYKDFSPDILYERYNLYYHAGHWLKKKTNIPYILEVNAPLREERSKHGGLSLNKMAQRSEQSLWRAADIVLPVTGVLAEKVAAAGVDEKKIHVIQNGVDTDFLEEHDPLEMRARLKLAQRLEGQLVLGFTGFVRDWHGVDRVLNYMAKNRAEKLHLLLVGDGPARAELEAQARFLELEDHFTVTGIVQRDQVSAYVSLFDIALQPAVVDYASPLKLFEYMAMGRAIIAPDAPNIKEVLDNGTNASLFDNGDETALHQGLKRLVQDKNLRDRLGREARQTLERDNYTWSGNAKRVHELALSLINQATSH